MPYENSTDFVAALESWGTKYKTVQSTRSESAEQTILRLSEKLCGQKSLLEVDSTLPVDIA